MTDWDYSIVWQEAMNQLQEELSSQEFTMWFNIAYVSSSEGSIVVAVPSNFYRDQVVGRYLDRIENKIQELFGSPLKVQIITSTKESITFEPKTPIKNDEPVKNTSKPRHSEVQVKIKDPHPSLPENQTFDTYVIGDNNKFACNAAMAISNNPGKAYNPCLIYGGVGLGKTHLMRAIGNKIYKNSDMKVIFITAEEFTNEFISSMHNNQSSAFKNKYRYTDVLLIDDIHFLQGKEATQEELFHTFNALYDANKQMVFTCDRPVSELKNLSARLRSRFERGLNVDLQPPSYEMRVAIMRKKAETRNINIPNDVIELIGKHITTNVRDLESALTKLFGYIELVGKELNIDIARDLLKDVFASPKQVNLTVELIQKVIADEFQLSFTDLKGKKRTKNVVLPRQLAMFISRQLTDFSTTELGMEFGGRDHTTVMHSCQKMEEKILADPSFDARVKNLIRSIKEYSSKG